MRRRRSEAGQATVEVVALLPVLLVVTLAAAALLAGHGAREQAGQAAQAGAMALLQGGDPRAAARKALPDGVRGRATVELHGRRVTVRVRPSPAGGSRRGRDDGRRERRRRPGGRAVSGAFQRTARAEALS